MAFSIIHYTYILLSTSKNLWVYLDIGTHIPAVPTSSTIKLQVTIEHNRIIENYKHITYIGVPIS